MAAAAAEVERAARSRVLTSTSNPDSHRRTPTVRPETPPPTTIARGRALTRAMLAREQVVALVRPGGKTIERHEAHELVDELPRHVGRECWPARERGRR